MQSVEEIRLGIPAMSKNVRQANAGSVMPAYYDIDNEPCHASRYLLTEVLRNQWGFDGLVVADYAGINLLHTHHAVTRDKAEAAAQAFNAGLDIELPGFECAEHLSEAIERLEISEEKFNEIVARVLTEKFRLGLFENPYVDEKQVSLQSNAARELAREVALQSVVLLENKGILPPSCRRETKSGCHWADGRRSARNVWRLQLPGSSDYRQPAGGTRPIRQDSVAGAERTLWQRKCELCERLRYSYRTQRGGPGVSGGMWARKRAANLDRVSPISLDTSRIQDAVDCARQSDVAIVFAGDLAGLFQTGTVGEGSDTDSLRGCLVRRFISAHSQNEE
jgi:Glycosyl hydrolase family 3 N terminal domain